LRFQASPSKKLARPHLNRKKLDMLTCTCYHIYCSKHGPGWPGQEVRPHLKSNQSKRTEGVAQAVGCLLCRLKALSSNPSKKEDKLPPVHLISPPFLSSSSCPIRLCCSFRINRKIQKLPYLMLLPMNSLTNSLQHELLRNQEKRAHRRHLPLASP
jgi:hypothetical protein